MLSLLYSKPSLPSAGAADTAADAAPTIVDFNTIEQASANAEGVAGKKAAANGGGFLSLWPFGRTGKSDVASTPIVSQPAVLDDSNDRVIAMKKIDSSVLNEASTDRLEAAAAAEDGDDVDEDFIDIQLRQLSYAEVAALNLIAADNQLYEKKSRKRDGDASLVRGSSGASGDENLLVIDQEELLGKSITDMEMVDSFKHYEKFNADTRPSYTDGLSPEDQWDLYVEGKTPKKIIRKKKNHKQKKAPAHS